MIRSLAVALEAPAPFTIPPFLFNLMAGSIVGELLLNNKAVNNHKIIGQMKLELLYSTYREGLQALANDKHNIH